MLQFTVFNNKFKTLHYILLLTKYIIMQILLFYSNYENKEKLLNFSLTFFFFINIFQYKIVSFK